MKIETGALVGQQTPTIEALIERARALRPLLAERAAQTEADGRVSAEVAKLLVDAGLWRLTQPSRFGGYEMPPTSLLQLGVELGRACTSTAWCTMLANGASMMLPHWPLHVQQSVWEADPLSNGFSTFNPTGTSVAVDGGYMLEGRFPWSSNCDNSSWCVLSAFLPSKEGAPKSMGMFLLPAAEVAIDHDSWKVAGMCGTGSKTTFTRQPVFVPHDRVIRFEDILRGTTPGCEIPGNVIPHYAFGTFGGMILLAPILGAAHGALDWYLDAMRTKAKVTLIPGAPPTAAYIPQVQVRAASAQAKLDAAMALLMRDIPPLEAKVAAGQALTVAERMIVRRDVAFAAQQATEATNLVFEGAGASAFYSDVPIQRQWRDVNTGARHVTLDTQAIYSMVGQHLFGLEPKGIH